MNHPHDPDVPASGDGRIRSALRRWRSALAATVSGPGPERDDAVLMAKAAIATVVAWQLAVRVLDSPTPFYAPMAALLVVDKTIIRSLGGSLQRLLAVVVGMAIAWLVGTLVGVHWWSMLLVMFTSMIIARWHRLGDHGIQVPTMVLLSLLTVRGTDVDFTYLTILETVLGGLVGVLVNAVLVAPLHLTEPREALRDLAGRMEHLLRNMAEALRTGWDADAAREWYAESRTIGEQAPAVLQSIETGRESTRLNLRHSVRPARVDWDGYLQTVELVSRAQWHLSGIARTLVDAADEAATLPTPSAEWLDGYASVLDALASAAARVGLRDDAPGPSLGDHLDQAERRLDRLSDEVRKARLDDVHAWPAYGALVLEAQRIAEVLRTDSEGASVPTDTGPLRVPIAERVPAVAQLQEQAPMLREAIPDAVASLRAGIQPSPPDDDEPPPQVLQGA